MLAQALTVNPRIGIAAIFRNEFPYIVEWLAHHRVLGIDAFFIADNDSDDGSTELLAALNSLGYLEHLPFPTQDNTPPQMPAYATLMQAFAPRVDWMAFIDADEFLMPTGRESIKGILSDVERISDAGALAVNWAVYGSGGHVSQPAGLVVENFQRRAEKQLINNHHIKSIVRCAAFESVDGNPHIFRLRDGWEYVHADGTRLEHHPERGRGLSRTICWERLRLNHYVVKSRQEFDRRKSPKGSATRLDRNKGDGYFQHHDRNEVLEAVDPAHLDAVRKETARILETLVSHGHVVVERTSALARRTMLFKGIRGHVDKIEWSDDSLKVKGWALCGDGQTPDCLEVMLGEQLVTDIRLTRFARPDVQRHYPSANLMSGFQIEAALSGLAGQTTHLQVLAGESAGTPRTALAMPQA